MNPNGLSWVHAYLPEQPTRRLYPTLNSPVNRFPISDDFNNKTDACIKVVLKP